MGRIRAWLLSVESLALVGLVAALVVWYLISSTAFLIYFNWPTGAVWSNLIASALCVGLALWRIRAQAIVHHAAAMAQAARHHRDHMALLAQQHSAAMLQAQEHHADLRAHVTSEIQKAAA